MPTFRHLCIQQKNIIPIFAAQYECCSYIELINFRKYMYNIQTEQTNYVFLTFKFARSTKGSEAFSGYTYG